MELDRGKTIATSHRLGMAMSSSPLRDIPSTPSSSRHSNSGLVHYLPSSPLSSPKSSPLLDVQARRRSQYKSRNPSTPLPPRKSNSSSGRRSPFHSDQGLPALGSFGLALGMQRRTVSAEAPQKAFLRERFKARCIERAQKARERAVRARRWSEGASDGSSDGFDDAMVCEDDDEDDNDEIVMQDELFRRIMENAQRKKMHAYRLSYAYDVGSSIDPDMEDVSRWEHELREAHTPAPELTPDEIESEEIAAYAEEHAAQADFADLLTLPDELFAWSDMEGEGEDPSDESPLHAPMKGKILGGDVDMSG